MPGKKRRWHHKKHDLPIRRDPFKPFPQSDSFACDHPVKGAPLRSASLRDGFAALDWDPGLRQNALLMKRFELEGLPGPHS